MGRPSAESFFQWVRGGIVTMLVVLMAAVSSGALGDPAWASVVRPHPTVRQADNSDADNDDGTPPIVLNVNSTLDEIDANPGDGACASAAGRCTLRAAIMEANARGGRHTINLQAQTYVLTIPGTDETNSLGGDLNIRGRITVQGVSTSSTTIDANEIDRVFSVEDQAEADFRSLTIRNGKASFGGGIRSEGDLRVSGVIVKDNTATSTGGGVYGFQMTISDSTIAGNTVTSSTGSGGGVRGFGDVNISRSTVSGNSGALGAGLYIQGQLTLVNSTISGNTAFGNGSSTGLGGGLYFDQSFGEATLTNVTIANNAAPRGSGLYKVSGDLTVRNSIVATNTGGADCFRVGPITTAGNNIDGGTGCGFTSSSNNPSTDPKLGPLADNGGPTRTHALLAGSPAIDGGSNTGCPSTDQRGIQRPRDGDGNSTTICDIGAFEAPGTLGTLPPDNNQPSPDNDGDNVSLPEPDNHEPPPPSGQTSLASLACPGVARLSVFQTTGFSPGDTVRINPGGSTQEDARIADVGCGGRFIHLAGPLQYRHNVSETIIVTAPVANSSSNPVIQSSNDRDREQSKPKTEEQRQQAEQTNRSGRDDLHTEGDVLSVDLTKQPPEIVIGTRDGRQTIQLHCGSQCPTIGVGDYVQVDGTKENEGLFYADDVTVTRR